MNIEVTHYSLFIEVPDKVLATVYRMFAEMIEENKTDCRNFEGDEQALILTDSDNGAVIGAILWRETEPGEWWIQFGAVAREQRKNGYYKLLWDELVERMAQDESIQRIVGGTVEENTEMQAVMEKLGRTPYYRLYKFERPKEEENVFSSGKLGKLELAA